MLIRDVSRVIILGAGASCSYIESPTGLRPPLAREIIKTYHKLKISENRYVLIGNLINYIRDTRGIPPIEFSSWDEDLETFFSEVDEEITRYAEKTKVQQSLEEEELYRYSLSVGTYNQLIFLFASILNEIQNGPISIPYMLLANELNVNDIVITFNWDTLLDRALAATGLWSPSNGYFIRPEAIFDEQWKSPDNYKDSTNGPLYIKLHGSTNWLVPYHGFHLSTGEKYTMSQYAMEKLFVYLHSSNKYETYENRYWGPYQPFSYCYYPPNLPTQRDDTKPGFVNIMTLSANDLPEHGKRIDDNGQVYSMPLIVPPVRNKQYRRYGKIFSVLWDLSIESISKCKQLYVIGYSFPKTDVATREMFKKGLLANKLLEKVVIINPNPETIRDLFINEFGFQASKLEVREKKFEVDYLHQGRLL